MPPLYPFQTDAETIDMANDNEPSLAAYLAAITRARARPADLSGRKRVVGVAGVGETDSAPGRQQLLHLLDRPADRAARVTRLELTLVLDQSLVGAVETLGKDRRDVDVHGRTIDEHSRPV